MSDNKPTSIDHNVSSPPGHTLPDSTSAYALIHFDLVSLEGERRLRECLDAPKVLRAVREYERWLAGQIDNDRRTEETREGLTLARDILFMYFNDHDVTIPGWE
jgi:hypothetical protein